MDNRFKAIDGFTRKWEGGFVNDPKDPGGMTMAGISRKTFPNWIGWKEVDKVLKVVVI